jgi:hypothetical protein
MGRWLRWVQGKAIRGQPRYTCPVCLPTLPDVWVLLYFTNLAVSLTYPLEALYLLQAHLYIYVSFVEASWSFRFIGFAYQEGKDIVFGFILEYGS